MGDIVCPTTYAIQAEGLTKRFGDTQALAGIDLAARADVITLARG